MTAPTPFGFDHSTGPSPSDLWRQAAEESAAEHRPVIDADEWRAVLEAMTTTEFLAYRAQQLVVARGGSVVALTTAGGELTHSRLLLESDLAALHADAWPCWTRPHVLRLKPGGVAEPGAALLAHWGFQPDGEAVDDPPQAPVVLVQAHARDATGGGAQ